MKRRIEMKPVDIDTVRKIPLKYKTIYLAGGLFNAGEQVHNLLLRLSLSKYGFKVILPQIEAEKFKRDDGTLDMQKVVEDCYSHVEDPLTLVVANMDGVDAESGTVAEVATAHAVNGYAIMYRTDFRTCPEHEAGVNAMFRYLKPSIIYCPFHLSSIYEVEDNYDKLALRIVETIITKLPK